MSFLYRDRNLLEQLFNIAGGDQLKKSALAQPPAAAPAVTSFTQTTTTGPAVDLNAYRAAKPLLVNLQRIIDPKNAPPEFKGIPLGTDPTKPAPVANVQDFRTLGDFIQWAAENKLTWQGNRFAWKADEKQAAIDAGALEFNSFPRDRKDRDPVSRDINKIDVYALKDPLKGYLSYLRDNDARSNKVLEVMLKAIIEEINSKLTGEPIASKAGPEAAKSTLNQDALVDAFPSKELSIETWENGLERAPTFTGLPVQLTVKDLADQSAFFNWLKDMMIKYKTPDKMIVTSPVLAPKSDPCLAVHILYKRASYLKNKAAMYDKRIAPDYDKIVDLYLKSIQQYGSQIMGADDKPCSVTGPGTTTGAVGQTGVGVGAGGGGGAGAGAGGAGGGAGGAGGGAGGAGGGPGGAGGAGGRGGRGAGGAMGVGGAGITELIRARPLRPGTIDLIAIANFLDVVEKLLPNEYAYSNPKIEESINNLEKLLLDPAKKNFNLRVDLDNFKTDIKNVQSNLFNYFYALKKLNKHLSDLIYRIMEVYNSYFEDPVNRDSDNAMKGQISFARTNDSLLTNAISNWKAESKPPAR
jgi:hypothetical protein